MWLQNVVKHLYYTIIFSRDANQNHITWVVSFVSSYCEACPAPVIVILYAMSCYGRPCYKGVSMYAGCMSEGWCHWNSIKSAQEMHVSAAHNDCTPQYLAVIWYKVPLKDVMWGWAMMYLLWVEVYSKIYLCTLSCLIAIPCYIEPYCA